MGTNVLDGMYSYSDLNSILIFINTCISKLIKLEKYQINLSFALSTYRIVIEIDNNYQLDLRDSEFGDFKIGFYKKILNKTEHGNRLPNTVRNSIDMIHINADAIANSILNDVNANT